MEKLLVAGIDTVAGANLAADLAPRYEVTGLSRSGPVNITGCRTITCPAQDRGSIEGWIKSVHPNWIIYCGPAAHSHWTIGEPVDMGIDAVYAARHWAEAAEAAGCRFTVISSDGVFSGPWLFHDEQSDRYCETPAAKTVRAIEQAVLIANSGALIVRTNTYGWAPEGVPGFVGTLLDSLENETTVECDCVRHAAPILAADLADILQCAISARLQGVVHITGAERTNPFQFARLIAEKFGYSDTHIEAGNSEISEQREFGGGETTLLCPIVRERLDLATPMLFDGIRKLHDQSLNGDRARFSTTPLAVQDRVA